MTKNNNGDEWAFETRAIHVGQEPDPTSGAVIPPISLSTTFYQEEVGKHQGFDYSRAGNPTRNSLEECVASLENARFGTAFASGLAAEDAVLRILSPGDHIVLGNDVYGGTYRLISKIHEPAGLQWTAADLSQKDALESAMQPNTKLVWVETPTNPALNIVDIAAAAQIAHAHNALLVVDNTFATPYLQQPLELGADIVVHSSTKYLGGHSDVVGGFVAVNDEILHEKIAFTQFAAGAVPSPFDCYLLLRGIKTLALRMERHCQNATAVAEMLENHSQVDKVFYPFLPQHHNFEIAQKQMAGGGGMISFTVKAGRDAAVKLVSKTKIFTLAESLGAVESLIEHPHAMTHASSAGSSLEVDEALVRLSVGIEDSGDLIDDLRAAFDQI